MRATTEAERPPRSALDRLVAAVTAVTSVTAWDVRQGATALGFAGLAWILAWLVTGATDEGGVAWGERAARTLPLVPACAALGTWLGQARGWARGEGRALAALGRSPLSVSAAAIAGGAGIAWIAAAAMAVSGAVDVGGFFPVARAPDAFVALGGGAFADAASGYRFAPDGAIEAPHEDRSAAKPSSASSSTPPGGRAAAASSTALAGLALPLLVARAARGSWWRRLSLLGALVALSTLLFHAVAARRVGAAAAVVPSALALVLAAGGVSSRRVTRA